ncbi:hypothetical protein BD626DRAFT_517818 [Schizophyllum amplum]|uniref:Uncharacterized protein n=1 Tax=Schizophyllum amplum TaxID=97359 RepID=A0A550BW71_9AGAR|nr:hypothetical protein BD626DRAFT_517818 [Auriculariopsis ampla]
MGRLVSSKPETHFASAAFVVPSVCLNFLSVRGLRPLRNRRAQPSDTRYSFWGIIV